MTITMHCFSSRERERKYYFKKIFQFKSKRRREGTWQDGKVEEEEEVLKFYYG
jgi:hypothetical protein